MPEETFLGKLDRAQNVLATLQNLERMLHGLKLEMVGQGKKMTDVAGVGPDQKSITYKQRQDDLVKQRDNVIKDSEDLLPLVRELRDRLEQQAAQQFESAQG